MTYKTQPIINERGAFVGHRVSTGANGPNADFYFGQFDEAETKAMAERFAASLNARDKARGEQP